MYDREIYFCSEGKPHYNYEEMIYYDFPYSSRNPKGKNGKSAYEIAVSQGFQGTISEWIISLQGKDGITPHIGENGNWFIGDIDTNINASSGDCNLNSITDEEIDSYFDENIINDENDSSLTNEEIDSFFIL